MNWKVIARSALRGLEYLIIAGMIIGPTGCSGKPSQSRFMVSPGGIISDSTTRLEWIMKPEHSSDNTNNNYLTLRETYIDKGPTETKLLIHYGATYSEAEEWVARLNKAGGDWRLPTCDELQALYDNTTGWSGLGL